MRKASNYYDYIIVGTGIAGLYTALLAKESGTVLALTKGGIDDSNTRYAQGGIAAPIGKKDSPALHFQDTINAGAGLCDPEAVRILVHDASDRIADLIRLGVLFDTADSGEIDLAREAAHSLPRVLHAGGDATGEQITLTLSRRVRESGIRVLEKSLVTSIVVNQTKLEGIVVHDGLTGATQQYECRHLILATGGAGRLYKYTTNPDIATGDGIYVAFNCGATVTDMEFFQFHPTALYLPGIQPFLISEAVRGEGGILRNSQNQAFMHEYHPQGDLAPRDVVSRSIVNEMRKTGGDCVFLDVRHLPPSSIRTRFPNIYRFCREHGLDITREFIPVAPAAHYAIGGARVDNWGETSIQSIFAVGEVACSGVHGANRLASNSLLAALVFGKRAVERSRQPQPRERSQSTPNIYSLKERQALSNVPSLDLPTLQSLLWDKVGMLRSGRDLEDAANILATWQLALPKPVDRASFELNSLVLSARLMTEAALLREESRGTHFRTDFPDPKKAYEKHFIFKR